MECQKKLYMEPTHDVGKEYFEIPVEDRVCHYSEDPFEMVRIATSFNMHKEKKRSWRDSLIWMSCGRRRDLRNPLAYR